eukprot:COSAG01_NODE_10854_length_2062_cov_1.173692_1_plen_476_part_00
MPTAGSEGPEAASGRRAQLEALSKEELVQRLLSAEQQQQQKHEGTTSSAVGGGRGAPSSAGQGPRKRRKTNTPAQAGGASKVYRQDQRRSNGNFDFSKHRQRHVALRIAYFGHRFHGFAAQDDSDNTVEGHLFKALQRTCLVSDDVRSANYSRCGRTDIGVSAFGQVRPAPAPCLPPPLPNTPPVRQRLSACPRRWRRRRMCRPSRRVLCGPLSADGQKESLGVQHSPPPPTAQVVALHLRSRLREGSSLLPPEAVAAATAAGEGAGSSAGRASDAAAGTGAAAAGEEQPSPPATISMAGSSPPRVNLDADVETASATADAELDYAKMLNGVLPDEIRVLGWVRSVVWVLAVQVALSVSAPPSSADRQTAAGDVSAPQQTCGADQSAPAQNLQAHIPPDCSGWSARFSCLRRVYHYYFVADPTMDLGAMRTAASAFVGEHDFRSFCKMDIEHVTREWSGSPLVGRCVTPWCSISS